MIFGGFQKLTLLDFPGKIACTLFTKGCNFYCPFCHNAFLVNQKGEDESHSEEEILDYLKKRSGVLEGVCVTGGEPLLHDDIGLFLKEVKKLGYAIKLDTNGSFPEKLKALAESGMIDYVAMDVKNSFEKYPLTSGCENLDLTYIKESIDYLLQGKIDYEFRTTVARELHTPQDIEKISEIISGAEKYYLQNFVDSGNILGNNLHPVDDNTLEEMKVSAAKNVKTAQIRGQS